jgi:hypothetical protein
MVAVQMWRYQLVVAPGPQFRLPVYPPEVGLEEEPGAAM